jgi:hypothetical protein
MSFISRATVAASANALIRIYVYRTSIEYKPITKSTTTRSHLDTCLCVADFSDILFRFVRRTGVNARVGKRLVANRRFFLSARRDYKCCLLSKRTTTITTTIIIILRYTLQFEPMCPNLWRPMRQQHEHARTVYPEL